MLTHTPKPNKTEYYQAEAIRKAIASQLARRVNVSDEMIAAKEALDEAMHQYKMAIERGIDIALSEYTPCPFYSARLLAVY